MKVLKSYSRKIHILNDDNKTVCGKEIYNIKSIMDMKEKEIQNNPLICRNCLDIYNDDFHLNK